MNKIKLSVIIPVYNVEKYLRRCLDSVIAQTLLGDIIVYCKTGIKDGGLVNSIKSFHHIKFNI